MSFKQCIICGLIAGHINPKNKGYCKPYTHTYKGFINCKECKKNTLLSEAYHQVFCSEDCLRKDEEKKAKKMLLSPKRYCRVCNKEIKVQSDICVACEDEILERNLREARLINREGVQIEVDVFKDFKNCKTAGVCDIVKAHHNILKDDPERLTSSFIIEQICGNEGKEYYLEKRVEREMGM